MTRYSAARDLTANQRDMAYPPLFKHLWMCGHQASSGQQRRVPGLRPIMWRCSECVAKAKV